MIEEKLPALTIDEALPPEMYEELKESISNGKILVIKPAPEPPLLSLLAPLVSWMGGGWPIPHKGHYYKDRLEGIDIDTEYELIKQKKSKLPRMLRDDIVRKKEKRGKR